MYKKKNAEKADFERLLKSTLQTSKLNVMSENLFYLFIYLFIYLLCSYKSQKCYSPYILANPFL